MKKLGIILILWFAFAPLLPALPSPGDDAIAFYQQAVRLRDEKQYAEAIKALDRAIQIDPRSAELYFLRADSYQKCNKYDNATADLKIAMKLDPKNVAYIYKYTKVGDVTNNVYQSIDGDTRRLVIDPTNYLIFQDRAEKFRMLNQFDSAYFDHSRAIFLATACKTKDKQIADLYKRRGQTLAWFKKYDRALADLEKALELNPNDIAMHINRAYICMALGQKQKAVADLSFAIEREKKTNALLNDLAERGHLYCDLKDFPKALTDANRMVSIESEYIDGYRLRATVYEGMGKHDLAKKDHDTAAKLGADWVLPKS